MNSCCEHITGGVNIYLYECVSVLAPECVHMSYQSRVPAKKYVSDPSVPDALLHESHSKVLVLRYQDSTCVDV